MSANTQAPGDMKFGLLLRELRTKAGLTQEALASRSRVPVNTVRTYEQGQRLPGLQAAARLARALGVSLDVFAACDEVIDVDPDPTPPPKRRKKPSG